jgi:hypothetical protein
MTPDRNRTNGQRFGKTTEALPFFKNLRLGILLAVG